MKIIFLSHDGSIHRLVEALEGDVHLAQSQDETLELLEDVADDEECLLFLDFDINSKEMEKFNKSIIQNEWITRIIVSGDMTVKQFKKHQKGKTSAHGYVLKPFTSQVLKGILNDLEISHLLEEQNLYEEGTQLPSLPSGPQSVQGLDSIDDSYIEEDDEVDEGNDFGASEFKMNTEVRQLVDLHSVKGDAPPFEGELNDKIQAKFDEVFQFDEDLFEVDEEVGQADSNFMGGGGGPSMDLSLKEETQESISLNLGEESTELSDGDDLDLGAELIEEDEEDSAEASQVDLDISDDEEIDLEAIDLDGDDDGGDLDLSDDGDDDGGELDLSDDDGGDEEIDLAADDLEDELDRLTEERALPTKEELAEFDEETGDIDISPLENSEEMSFDKPEAEEVQASDDSLDLGDSDDDFELSDDTGDFSVENNMNLEEDESESANEDSSQSSEDSTMSDDNQDNDELLEFEDEELAEDGELAFSTEPEAEESISGDSEDEGGLDFNLGAIDEDGDSDDMGLETSAPAVSAGGDEEGGFSLEADDVDGMDLETDVESVSESPAAEADAGGGMELEADLGDDEDFELGDDAVLGAESDEDSSGDDALEMSDDEDDEDDDVLDMGDDDEGDEVVAAAAEDSGDSEFDSDELSFADDDDDEEIEKTQAVSLSDIQASAEDEAEEDDDVLEALGDEDDFDDSDIDLDGDGEDDFDADAISASAEDDSDDFASDEELLDGADDFEEDTNPTVVMTDDVTKDLENMVDNQVTNEFRPGMEDNDTALLDEEDLLGGDDALDEGTGEFDVTQSEPEPVAEEPVQAALEKAPVANEGTLNITKSEERVPPSFNEGEAVRLQATIRQLREEREELLQEIQNLKKEKKLTEQDNLGLKAELDEAKIEISILKKRHSSEMDEMKYRLRITDEKKLYSEEKARKLQKEFDRLQSKVRIDFNQIKQREKELESQLELAKMDSESQVQSRDKKILELKRKIDQLEFNMENIVIREQKSRDDKVRLEERLERIMKTLRGSIEVLEDDIEFDGDGKRNRE